MLNPDSPFPVNPATSTMLQVNTLNRDSSVTLLSGERAVNHHIVQQVRPGGRHLRRQKRLRFFNDGVGERRVVDMAREYPKRYRRREEALEKVGKEQGSLRVVERAALPVKGREAACRHNARDAAACLVAIRRDPGRYLRELFLCCPDGSYRSIVDVMKPSRKTELRHPERAATENIDVARHDDGRQPLFNAPLPLSGPAS